MTACPNCENGSFRLEELVLVNANYKYFAVQCTSCSTPIGVLDYDNIGVGIEGLEERLDSVTSKLDELESAIGRLRRSLDS